MILVFCMLYSLSQVCYVFVEASCFINDYLCSHALGRIYELAFTLHVPVISWNRGNMIFSAFLIRFGILNKCNKFSRTQDIMNASCYVLTAVLNRGTITS